MSTTVASITVRPTGESIDPTKLDQSQYWDIAWVAYVLDKTSEQRTRPTRVITSHGPLHAREANPVTGSKFRDLMLGDEIKVWGDEKGDWLGDYRVVGIAREDTGAVIGNVPAIRIKHQVVK